MYIKSVTIDGFKSYAQRTEVTGFDPLFNAITGLNGSGKSNILDSICFLLGITNLSQVRASNLQELVYKSGQAGINKATVSIIFDNSNKEQSPIGMEANNEITITRQIVIGGRNKYLINGVNAQNSRVTDLFRSVGLNVNNPHFLIMQGRVTKVMNMKPPEILSMIEEATGTSMYEAKKEAAQKMIDKKESKIRQINAAINDEITPMLEKLHEERSSYLKFQMIQRESTQLKRLLIAYSYYSAKSLSSRAEDEMQDMNKEKEEIENKIKEAEELIAELAAEIKTLEMERDNTASNSLKMVEENLLEQQRLEAKAQSDFKHHCDCINAEQKKMRAFEKNKRDDESLLQKKETELNKIKNVCEKLKQDICTSEDACEKAQKHYEAVSSGLASADSGEDATWNMQLMNSKKEISDLQSCTKQASMKLKHSKVEIKKKSELLHKTEANYKKDEQALKQLESKVANHERELNKLQYEDGTEENLQTRRRELMQQHDKLKRQVDQIYTQYPGLQFDYSDPEPNFNRSKVKGLVAELIDLKPEHATALEVVAGGRLYNVVVDEHLTSEKLLKHGKLQRRLTIIPMNKISARCLSSDVIKRAKDLVGADNAHLALSLVNSNPSVRKAMEYVFGGTIICNNMDNAMKVAFGVNVRTVTFDGELFDPAGTLTGGAQSKRVPMLSELMRIKDARHELKATKNELRNLEKQLQSVRDIASKFRTLQHQLELKQQECNIMKNRLSNSTHGKQIEEINELKRVFAESEEILATSKDKENALIQKCKELEAKIANAPAEREKELMQAEKEMKNAEKNVESAKSKAGEKIDYYETLRLEISEVEKEIDDYKENIKEIETTLEEMKKKKEELSSAHVQCKQAVANCQSEIKDQRKQIHLKNQGIQERATQASEIRHSANEADLELKEKVHAISRHMKESSEAANKMKSLEEEYDWIVQEQDDFGKAGTVFDFDENNPKETAKKLSKLEEQKNELSSHVNMRAMSLLGKAEENYQALLKKKTKIEGDRKKIERTIEELDQKKNDAVTMAYEQVNKDFGKIFSMLLPGSTAKLSPPEGQSVLAGLEFRVGFGDVWKDNLSELSGGQRSLVALSLILAMLLLKPAPIYILDEVDAALDLSHTQNIGRMLREHFKRSQFIVVSLKDGMFNNANVLFRTKFVDGVSTVARHVQQTLREPLATITNGDRDKTSGKRTSSKTHKSRVRS